MNTRFDFVCERPDPLGVLTSTAKLAEAAQHVRIDEEAVRAFARAHAASPPPVHAQDRLHCTFLPPEQFCNYLLALEALNFCFWDAVPRWRVQYLGGNHDGYWALAAALRRALKEDALPLWDANYLAQLDVRQTAHMLRGSGRPPPLLNERVENLREAGRVLMQNWDGQFANLIASCNGDAPSLVMRITEAFPSFRDEGHWRGQLVRFYKRAQICAADLARLLPDHPLGRLERLEDLTAFADYKVPQVMRKEGVLVPAAELAERIDRGEELARGSEEEMELRAATLWGCEWIARALATERSLTESAPNAAEVDYLLWSAGQHKQGLPPYHRTRTIYY
jgi:hypothetical protein